MGLVTTLPPTKYTTFLQISKKNNWNHQLKNVQSTWTGNSQKRKCKWPISTRKENNLNRNLENTIKITWGIPSKPSNWHIVRWTIPRTGKDVKKWKLPYTPQSLWRTHWKSLIHLKIHIPNQSNYLWEIQASAED